MTIETLRFAVLDAGQPPAHLDLDIERLDRFLDDAPAPAVFVLRTRDMRSLLAGESAKRRLLRLRKQAGSKGLVEYFHGDAPVALEGKYTEPGRLRSAVKKFLASAPARSTHFLGVTNELFDELARRARIETNSPEDAFLGTSFEAGELRKSILLAAIDPRFMDVPVLVVGPTGSGKEVVARAIHERGRGARAGKWFAVNCAAIPGDLFEAELFGVEEGTATDVKARIGYWEEASASHGTLLLNEIGELRLDQQAKLLRALEEKEITRVGGRTPIRVHARIIADTNRNLRCMIEAGTFREDLYHRIAQIVIPVPNLAERGNDLDEIAQRIWRERLNRSPRAALSPEIIEALRMHKLTGGFRELVALLRSLSFRFPNEVAPSVRQLLEAWRARGGGPNPHAVPVHVQEPAAMVREPGPLDSLRGQVELFATRRSRYQRLTGVLREALEKIAEQAAPFAMVHARTKSIASFAERVQRDQARFDQLRDLCGARIIVHTEDQIRNVCALLERYFEIDAKESVAEETPVGVPRRAFAARRLIVRLDRHRAQSVVSALGVEVPNDVLGLWAEIEVQTVLEYAWAHISRDMGHRERIRLPAHWSEELRAAAAVLEAVDAAFARIHEGFATYRTSYRVYLSPEQKKREIAILTNVLACDPDPSVAVRLGKLAISDGEWDRAIAVLDPHAVAGYQPALRDLGVAICQKYREETESSQHARGQQLLEQACAEPYRDPDAWASLGGTWKRRGRYDKAREYYGRAHAIDPADPYALGGLLEAELVLHPNAGTVATLEPSIRQAIKRCREHVEVGVNLPWALYDLGKFLLLLGERTQGLVACARAVELTTSDHGIWTSLQSLDQLAAHHVASPSIDEARRILALGRAVKFPSPAAQQQLEKLLLPTMSLTAPVVFVVDGLDESEGDAAARRAAARRAAVADALRDTPGTVVTSDWLQGWANVVASGIRPSEVVLLPLGSRYETELERCVGAALGARVVEEVPTEAKAVRQLLGAE